MNNLITNIQRFSLQDGPGIRTTVFMKGCTLRCPWCSNPENQSYEQELYTKGYDIGVYGEYYSPENLVDELVKDQMYWNEKGGVTFSGGEPLSHMEYLDDVFSRLKKKGINIAVETSLYVNRQCVDKAIKYVDFFFIDIKILEPDMCKNVMGGDVELFLENLRIIYEKISYDKIVFRIPCSEFYTLNKINMDLILNIVKRYKNIKVEIFLLHDLGREKYETLNREYCFYRSVNDESVMMELYDKLISQGCFVEIKEI